MNGADVSSLIEMIKPLAYVFGAYVIYSVIRSIFTKQKNNDNKKSK